jgi:hypothetical protein
LKTLDLRDTEIQQHDAVVISEFVEFDREDTSLAEQWLERYDSFGAIVMLVCDIRSWKLTCRANTATRMVSLHALFS